MQPSPRITRRQALGTAAAVGTAYFIPTGVLGGAGRTGANERVRIGLIGAGVRGKYLIANLPPAAQVVALCDCYLPRVAQTLKPTGDFARPLAMFAQTDAARCSTHQDYRRMLDRQRLDAVVIATPEHHHVQIALLALQRGLDVYVEKPLTLTIAEGRALVEAAGRTDRIVQVGSQQRTMEMNVFACRFIREGGLGRVHRVELPNYPGPMPHFALPEEPPPEGLDWNLFCGPRPLRAHHRRRWVKEEFEVDGLLWRGWDLWHDFSGHIMTNWGAHSVDMVQLALGKDDTGPVEVWLPPAKSDERATFAKIWAAKTPPLGSVPDRSTDAARFRPVAMRYADGTVLEFTSQENFTVFHGERGKLTMSRNKFTVDPPELVRDAPDPAVTKKWEGPGHVARPHLANWLACLASRKTPNAPLESGHRTVTVCHLANLARQLGRKLRWDPKTERFAGDDEADALLDRPRRKVFELPKVG